MRECPRCCRSYDPSPPDLQSKCGALIEKRRYGCSIWCPRKDESVPWEHGDLAVFHHLVRNGTNVIRHTLKMAAERPPNHDFRFYLWGHDFTVTGSPTEIVSEYLDWTSKLWFYSDDEAHDLAYKLYSYAFDLKYGVPA